MPKLTDLELQTQINSARLTGKFKNSDDDYEEKDISIAQFTLIEQTFKTEKITEFKLIVKKIDDKSLEILAELFSSHPELQNIYIDCNEASLQQIEKFAAILPVTCKQIFFYFYRLNETNLTKILENIQKISNLESLELKGGSEEFGAHWENVMLSVSHTFYQLQNLKKFSIIHGIEECENSEHWEKYSKNLQTFLDVRNNQTDFFSAEKLPSFDTIVNHLNTQLPLIAVLLNTRYLHKDGERYFEDYLKYLIVSSFSYTQIPKLLNCFVSLFNKIPLEKCLTVYAVLADRIFSADIGTQATDLKKLVEKKTTAVTFYLQYQLCAQILNDSKYPPQKYENILVNLLNDLSHHGMVTNQTIMDFFNLHSEEFRDILADVAECMNTCNLPAKADYKIIDETNCQSLLSSLMSENGRKQLIKRKHAKMFEDLKQENRFLKNTIEELKEEISTLQKKIDYSNKSRFSWDADKTTRDELDRPSNDFTKLP